MSLLEDALSRLEARLTTLVEGSAARLFPADGLQKYLASRLVDALREGIQLDPLGKPLAPNLFTIMLPPAQAQSLAEDQALLGELARGLAEVGEETGVQFPTPPIVKVQAASEVGVSGIRILAQVSGMDLGETATIKIPIESEGGAVPRNAFLIVNGAHIYPLTRGVVNIGRHPDNHLVLDDPRVSLAHAQMRAVHGRYLIFDLGSDGGTLVNSQPVTQSPLSPGDVVSLAGVPLVFGQESSTLSGETQEVLIFPITPPEKDEMP